MSQRPSQRSAIKERLAASDGGSLDDAEFVATIRGAAGDAELWGYVAPTVKNELLRPTAEIEVLGGSLDDLFVMRIDSLATLAHPINRDLSQSMRAIDHVKLSLDMHLRNRHDETLRRGKALIDQLAKFATNKTDKADKRAKHYLSHIDARKRGITKETAMLELLRGQLKRNA